MRTAFATVLLALATAPPAGASFFRDKDKRLACLAEERRDPGGCTSIRDHDDRVLCGQRAGERDLFARPRK